VDWLRGVAVICMIEWHVLDAWTNASGHEGAAWIVVSAIGGAAAPLFLFLAGVAVPFAISGHVGRGADPGRAAWLVQKRGWQVFGLAHLFRLQSFLVNPNAPWSDVLKPDILNILGLGLAGTAWLVGRGGSRQRRIWWLLVPSAVVLVLTPLAPEWSWPSLLYPRFEAYIRPVGNLGVFALFPWVAFVPVGAFAGLLMLGAKDEEANARVHRSLAAAGATVAVAGLAMGVIGAPSIAFWTHPWSTFLIKAGLMVFALWIAWAWLRKPRSGPFAAPVILLGRTSLFVYWVHVEFAYGGLSYPLHRALPLGWAVVGLAVVIVGMYFAARWWSQRTAKPWIPQELTINN
jgi:uncharacterized membrane protein